MPFFRRLSAGILSLLLLAPLALPAAAKEPTVAVIVDTTADASAEELLAQIPGATLLCSYTLFDGFAAEIPAGAMRQLQNLPGVISVSRSAVFDAPLTDAEEYGISPDVIDAADAVIRADDLTAGEGTVIAVIDSGFDVTHPVFALDDAAERAITRESIGEVSTVALRYAEEIDDFYVSDKIPLAFDYDGMDFDVSSSSAHGTHVASTAAGSSADGGKMNGVAPGAQLLLMKVFDDTAQHCYEYALVSAVQDAIKLGADIINLSLGKLSLSSEVFSMASLARALEKAEAAGILIVCAGGNNGFAGAEGLYSDLPAAANPDYGLPSEPANLPRALTVASADNNVTYADYIEAGGRQIFYTETSDVLENGAKSFSERIGGRTLRLVNVPGWGEAADYENLNVSGAAVLVQRGEITFTEKIQNAADASAAAIIVYDPESDETFSMSVNTLSSIPAISVSRDDGEYLAALVREPVYISAAPTAVHTEQGIAYYSSWGPSSDLKLKPEITAVGSSVIAAVPGGGYSMMSGTSMAAPQIAGMAACLLSKNPALAEEHTTEELSAYLKLYLMNASAPMLDANDKWISPRAQGAGLLNSTDLSVMLETEDGGALLIGEGAEDGFSFTLTVTSLADTDETYHLRIPMMTDAAEQDEDGVWYITGESENIHAIMSVSGSGVTRRNGRIYVKVPAGETVTLKGSVTPNADEIADLTEIFTNGFYIEGFFILETLSGEHAASLPYLGFAGSWGDAPMLDALDWDGDESYYGMNLLLQNMRGETAIFGYSEEGVLSTLFSFSPNDDSAADEVYMAIAALRNIADLQVEVLDAEGNTVYENDEGAFVKSFVESSELEYELLLVWNGSDGVNDHYRWADGEYTVRLTLYSYADTMEIWEFPMRLDTKAPTLVSVVDENGVLTAEFTDDHALRELLIYLPDPDEDGEHVIYESVTPEGGANTAAVSAEIPAGTVYVYISAEDFAGNRTLLRYYL